MKCPNCNAVVSEESEYCGPCGHPLPDSGRHGHEDDFLDFYKSAILSPWKSIGRRYHASTALIAITLLLSILSLSLVIRLTTAFDSPPSVDPTPFMPFFITFVVFFIILASAFLIYLGMTHVMQSIVISNTRHWKQVFSDFSMIAVILNILYILFVISVEILPSTIALLSLFIGFILSISAPVVVVLKYAKNDDVKDNIVLAMFIYYIIVIAVNLVLFWPIFNVALNNLLNNIMMF